MSDDLNGIELYGWFFLCRGGGGVGACVRACGYKQATLSSKIQWRYCDQKSGALKWAGNSVNEIVSRLC